MQTTCDTRIMSTRHRHGSHNFLRACVLATVAAAAEGEKLSPSLSGLPRSIHRFFDNPPQPVTKTFTLAAMCTIKGEKGTGSEKKSEVLSRRNPRHRSGARIKKQKWATVDLFPPRPLNAVSWFGRSGLRAPPWKACKTGSIEGVSM